MNREIMAMDILRELNNLSRSLRANETQITAAYARQGDAAQLPFGGISATDALVLDIIGDNPEANGQFIAGQMAMTKGGVSKILARLQKKQLIKARKDESDYKSNFYSLTQNGGQARAFHTKLISMAAMEMEKMIADYSEKELDRIHHFLADVATTLHSISQALAMSADPSTL